MRFGVFNKETGEFLGFHHQPAIKGLEAVVPETGAVLIIDELPEGLTHFKRVNGVVVDNPEARERQRLQEAIAATEAAVDAAIAKGAEIIKRFASENVRMGIDLQTTDVVLERLSKVLEALRTGSLHVAIKRIKEIPDDVKDQKFITNERLLKAVHELEDYLGLPPSSSL